MHEIEYQEWEWTCAMAGRCRKRIWTNTTFMVNLLRIRTFQIALFCDLSHVSYQFSFYPPKEIIDLNYNHFITPQTITLHYHVYTQASHALSLALILTVTSLDSIIGKPVMTTILSAIVLNTFDFNFLILYRYNFLVLTPP